MPASVLFADQCVIDDGLGPFVICQNTWISAPFNLTGMNER